MSYLKRYPKSTPPWKVIQWFRLFITKPEVIRYSAKSWWGMPSFLCFSKLKPDYLNKSIESSIDYSSCSSNCKLNYQAKVDGESPF
jgi:hypothetical protein